MPLISNGYKILDKRNIYNNLGAANTAYSGAYGAVPSGGDNTTITFEAGEDILAGNAVFIDSDGKAYVSSDDSAVGRYCDCIALNDVLSGGDVNVAYQNGSIIDNDLYEFLTGEPVYLGSGAQNITSIVPCVNGKYRQVLGKAVTSNSFAMNLDNMPSRIKIE